MTATNVKSAWVGGDLYFYDKDGNVIFDIDGTNRLLEIPDAAILSVTGSIAYTNIDAGASGTAGSVDIFPTTAAKGKLALTAADSAGDTTTTLVNASQSGARTYTIPDAGASASFVMTEGAQTVNGTKTIAAIVTTNIDAGASGTAGTVDIFPSTASKGKIALTAADSAGDTTTTIVNASQAGARTYTIPDAGASASFVMTAGAQSIGGDKTFTGSLRAPEMFLPASADAAITLTAYSQSIYITKAGVCALTLADPTVTTHDGSRLTIIATTANAHTVSNAAGSGFNAGGAASDVATFGGAIGDNMIIEAYQGKWYVVALRNVTLG